MLSFTAAGIFVDHVRASLISIGPLMALCPVRRASWAFMGQVSWAATGSVLKNRTTERKSVLRVHYRVKS